jgi:hypothetical protein
MLDALVADFRADPRNKVFVGEELLLASVSEYYIGFHASSVSAWHWPGVGRANAVLEPAGVLSASKTKPTDVEVLRRVIRAYQNGGCSPEEGGLDEAGLEIYDAAVAVCYSAAKRCFSTDDHTLTWLVGHDDDFVAELRPW